MLIDIRGFDVPMCWRAICWWTYTTIARISSTWHLSDFTWSLQVPIHLTTATFDACLVIWCPFTRRSESTTVLSRATNSIVLQLVGLCQMTINWRVKTTTTTHTQVLTRLSSIYCQTWTDENMCIESNSILLIRRHETSVRPLVLAGLAPEKSHAGLL